MSCASVVRTYYHDDPTKVLEEYYQINGLIDADVTSSIKLDIY
jgi:hypothetical protein